MNWEAIGAIGEIAGAVGVIVTLLYLSVQIRQNTKESRLTAIQAASENSAQFTELLATHPDLGELFWKGLQHPDDLSPEDLRRFMMVLNVFLRREAVAFYLHREGMMPDEFWTPRVNTLKGQLNQPGTRVFMEMSAESLPSEFSEFMMSVISQDPEMNEKIRAIIEGVGTQSRNAG